MSSDMKWSKEEIMKKRIKKKEANSGRKQPLPMKEFNRLLKEWLKSPLRIRF